LGLSIPIYNNYRAKGAVKQAELAVENARLNNEQTKETLKNNIQTALNDARAAANSYEAAKRSTVAQQLAYNNAKTKFDIGAANTFELLSAKNRLDIAVTEELVTRYDYIFRTKVIDYYLGRRIALN
jgi:outer membrane protein